MDGKTPFHIHPHHPPGDACRVRERELLCRCVQRGIDPVGTDLRYSPFYGIQLLQGTPTISLDSSSAPSTSVPPRPFANAASSSASWSRPGPRDPTSLHSSDGSFPVTIRSSRFAALTSTEHLGGQALESGSEYLKSAQHHSPDLLSGTSFRKRARSLFHDYAVWPPRKPIATTASAPASTTMSGLCVTTMTCRLPLLSLIRHTIICPCEPSRNGGQQFSSGRWHPIRERSDGCDNSMRVACSGVSH